VARWKRLYAGAMENESLQVKLLSNDLKWPVELKLFILF
jgi:hypothetical protein